ncbi:unnamed protein product [Cylicocyclus nassatus]|uniref:DNA2/NAM7 helicase helicase domain-containing protein n=1 Tax=Cylicocyclus nassatus TaxID=53992 RepID=A0AA36GMM8_CYLNA|nr:unnamed protein product [Cylicocyclus nassatus]
MSSIEGWTKHRPVGVWIMDVWWFTKLEVDEVEFQEETRELRVTLATYSQMEQVLRNAIRNVGRRVGNTAFLDLFVKLGRTPANANPAFESVSRMEIYKDLEEGGTDVSVVDIAYGAQELGCKTAEEAEGDEDEPLIDSITLHGRRLELTRDQQEALALGNSKYPLIAIQAAFGTGKTVVGACVAIRQALAGQRVIITASTNTAVAQFANTILEFGEAQQVGVTRFVAEAIAFDTDAPTTAVDLPEILKMIGTVFQRQLTRREKETCRIFTQGRIRYERTTNLMIKVFVFSEGWKALNCYGSPTSTLYQGLDLSSRVLDMVKDKFYFMRTAVDRQKQGIQNLRNAPINDYEIASLEPAMMQTIAKLSRVISNPSLLNRLDTLDTSNLIGGLATLRSILPPGRADFDAKFRSEGAARMISQALSQINIITNSLGI